MLLAFFGGRPLEVGDAASALAIAEAESLKMAPGLSTAVRSNPRLLEAFSAVAVAGVGERWTPARILSWR